MDAVDLVSIQRDVVAYRNANKDQCRMCEGAGKFDEDGGRPCKWCSGTGKVAPFFPMLVTAMGGGGCKDVYHPKVLYGGECGDFVAIRPIFADGDPRDGKTYLGVVIGELATSVSMSRKSDDDTIAVVGHSVHNPMIFVPDLKRVVFGYESWWGRIETPDDLRQITDADINNVWYVQALKALSASEKQGDTE